MFLRAERERERYARRNVASILDAARELGIRNAHDEAEHGPTTQFMPRYLLRRRLLGEFPTVPARQREQRVDI